MSEKKIPQKESELFNWIKEKFITDLEGSKNPYSRYDCFSPRFKLDIELKCRRTHYDGLLIEKKKYDALMLRAKEFNTLAVYINSTPKGIWGFYLSSIPLVWETKMLPKNTDFGNRIKIPKEIAYLNISEGVNLWEN
jgi:hypothetical protein